MENRILIVDDDVNICDLLEIYLEKEGYKVYKANSGVDALKIFKERQLDLIVLDVMMPEIDGIDTALELTKRFNLKALKFIFLTNYGEENWPEEVSLKIDEGFAKQIGAITYLRKHIPLEEIIKTIEKLLKE